MNDLIKMAAKVQAMFESQRWQFCFIGGIAIQKWGEPRVTRDMDITLLTGFGDEEKFIEVLLLHFIPRRPDAAAFAVPCWR